MSLGSHPSTRNKQYCFIEIVTFCVNTANCGGDFAGRRSCIAGQYAWMRFEIQCRIGTTEIGVLAHDGAVGFARICKESRIRGSQLKVVTDDCDIVPFAAKC